MDEYPKILDEFAFYKLTVQNRSKLTVEQYLTDLSLFFRYLIARQKNISTKSEEFDKIDISSVDVEFCKNISSDDVYSFFMYAASERDNHAKSRARKLSSLRSFFKYLTVKRHYFEENPVKDIESPSVKPALPKYLTEEECIKLLEAVENYPDSKNRVRDYCIITPFLNCGMRLSELVGISLKDIDPSLRSLRVTGKGSKERIIYLNEACQNSLSAWILHRQSLEIKDRSALFISSRGSRISNKTVQALVYKYLNAAGLGYRHLSVHKLRHTAATLMYQSGQVDVRVLKEILGHEQLNTTQIYTHVSNAGMEEAMKHNPLSTLHRKGPSSIGENDIDSDDDGKCPDEENGGK